MCAYEWQRGGGQGVSPCLCARAGRTIWAGGGWAPDRERGLRGKRMSVCVCTCAHRGRKVGSRRICLEVCVSVPLEVRQVHDS